jgi:hypothetical protein
MKKKRTAKMKGKEENKVSLVGGAKYRLWCFLHSIHVSHLRATLKEQNTGGLSWQQ